jgi:hypothetical protein
MKPLLEFPSQYRSEYEFYTEVWTLLAKRGFYNLGGRVVHVVEAPGKEARIIEVTPEYFS